jgi:putative peptide zinc metalloprotease protein
MQDTYTQTSQTLVGKSVLEIPESPALAPGVQLVGELPETGFTEKQWLAVRNGKFIQLGELLYRVAEFSNGKRTLVEIAQRMTETTDWQVTEDHVRQILQKMIPLGIIDTGVSEATYSQEQEALARPADNTDATLGMTMRAQVIGPHTVQPIARVLQIFYKPIVLIPLLVIIAVAHAWLYIAHGLSQGFMDILYRSWGFPIVLGLLILGGVFHEFGHAAALAYGGGQVRGMGAGLYLFYPAFYTDLTDSYRLGRWARVRTDLGGFYFHLIFSLAIIGLYFLTGYEFLLLTGFFINLDILYQLIPFVRLDGYWVMADLTGIPDPITYMKPFLASLIIVPGKKRAQVAPLRPQVRRIFLIYTLLTVPLLLLGLALFIYRLPGIVIRFYDSISYQIEILSLAWRNGDIPGLLIVALSILLLGAIVLGSLYVFFLLARRFIVGLWNWSKPTLRRRMSGSALAVLVTALVTYTWLPYFQTIFKSAPINVQTYQVTSREHTDQPVTYDQSPPVGGDHAPIWQNCGFYDTPIQNEHAIHSMEHGAVWITYSTNLPANQVSALRRLAYRQPYVLVSPYPDLQSPLVATAWGVQLSMESVNNPALEQFIRAYRLGEQAPEKGEPCIGGTGTPR